MTSGAQRLSGIRWDDPDSVTFVGSEVVSSDVRPHAIDPQSAQRLWRLSERLLKP